jgi:lipid A 3-O-deacylase
LRTGECEKDRSEEGNGYWTLCVPTITLGHVISIGARRTRGLLIVLALVAGWTPVASAQWLDRQGPVRTVIEENDLLVKTDRHYTQGAKVSSLYADDTLPGWLASLSQSIPRIGMGDHGPNKYGYELGQSIFTPADLTATHLLKHDRPYAGWLYTGMILQRRGMLDEWPVLENFQVDVGIIGPDSLAEDTQIGVHEFRGFEIPRGWRNQLHDEPGLALKYQRSWIFSPSSEGPRWVDLIPQAGLSLGNVETSFRAGTQFRLGVNLPNDFGVSTITSLGTTGGGWSEKQSTSRYGFYVFGAAESWTVLYTVFLDGNTFRRSPSVDKRPFVAEVRYGAVLVLNRFELALTYVFRTPQFVGQTKDDAYGSIMLKIKY